MVFMHIVSHFFGDKWSVRAGQLQCNSGTPQTQQHTRLTSHVAPAKRALHVHEHSVLFTLCITALLCELQCTSSVVTDVARSTLATACASESGRTCAHTGRLIRVVCHRRAVFTVLTQNNSFLDFFKPKMA